MITTVVFCDRISSPQPGRIFLAKTFRRFQGMKRFTKILAVGSAALALAVPASAQLGAPHPGHGIGALGGGSGTSYDHHWAPMHSPVGTQAWSGKQLFESIVVGPNFNGFGDAVRVCYGIDVTQGGRNWTGPGSSPAGGFGQTTGVGGGMTENTWFRVHQAFAPVALATAQAGADIGFVSIQAGATTDLAADNCFSPFFKVGSGQGVPGVETGGHKVGAVALPGLFSGTGVAAFPIYWEFSFNWAGSPALLQNKIGDDSGDPGIAYGDPIPARGLGNPLLANVIFEVQGPVNGPTLGFLGNQYYLSSTIEWGGLSNNPSNGVTGRRGLGGVTNGNGNWGFSFFGGGATGVNARDIIGATRFFGNAPSGLFIGTNKRIPTPLVAQTANFRAGRNEFFNSLAFRTPRAWAYHNFKTSFGTGANFHNVGPGHLAPGTGGPGAPVIVEGRDGANGQMLVTGNGGPDWRISAAPVSNVDIVSIDHEGGADINFNVYKRVGTYAVPNVTSPTTFFLPGGTLAHAAAGFNTTIGMGGFYFGSTPCYFPKFNRMVMLWSTSPSAPMIQLPGSWDNMGMFMGVEGAKGGYGLTQREGLQTAALNFDAITSLLSTNSLFLFGSRFRESDDFFSDGALDYGNINVPLFASIFEGGAVPMSAGQSDMKPANAQIPISTPDMSLRGVPIYLSIGGSHVDLCNGSAFETTEQYNALTIVLQ